MSSTKRNLVLVLLAVDALAPLGCSGNTVLGRDPMSQPFDGGAGGTPISSTPGQGGNDDAGGASGSAGGASGGAGGATGGAGGATGGAGGATGGAVTCGTDAKTDSAPGWIVFDSDRANFNRDIYMIRANGSSLTRLTTESGIDKEPAISPKGDLMAFTSDRGGSLQIYLMDLASKTVTRLTNLPAGADQSSFSHDGKLVTFHSDASVFVIHPDGTGLTMVATGLGAFNAYFWPHFRLDDQGLVFDRNNEIDTVALDGTGLRMVVRNTTTTIKSPSVSPISGDVAYHALCSGSGALSIWTTPFSENTSVCEGRRLTPVDEPASQRVAWGPNDTFAYERVDTTTNVGSIALIARTPGSVPCVLTPDLADNRNPTWSP
ncbi:MAG TPA: hypothetical protein VFH73_12375 [Polyangia bacterium]|jgi:dipeptidyl aminopeptidase/acylaminoacyl peptidase|nr:hypothetical protein [Polyangia bacterium]